MIKTIFKAALSESDIFKVPFILLFQNRLKSSTVLGTFFSLIIFGTVIYLFFKSNMLLKINPMVIDQTITNDHASLIELTPNNFEIAAGVSNSFGKAFSDPTIFKIQFIQIEIVLDEELNTKLIRKNGSKAISNCSVKSFSDPKIFKEMNLENYACPMNGSFYLEGGFDEKSVNAIIIMISYCDNETDGIVCKPKAMIENFFKDKGLWVYYQDDIYDVSNYSTPIRKNWRLHTIQCAAVPRIIDLYLKKLVFINDESILFMNEQKTTGFMNE